MKNLILDEWFSTFLMLQPFNKFLILWWSPQPEN